MDILKCHLVENRCYKEANRMVSAPFGIVVHSTGVDNSQLRRYVNPVRSQTGYETLLDRIGVNTYGNHWNSSVKSSCVHAFIGMDADGVITVVETLPFDYCCWGCGKGSKGSFNYNPTPCIQFEICEDKSDPTYFDNVFDVVAQYCAMLCDRYSIPVESVVSHKEAHLLGYASNHSDCDHWLKWYGKSMDWLRGRVQRYLNKSSQLDKPELYIYASKDTIPDTSELTALGYKVRILKEVKHGT